MGGELMAIALKWKGGPNSSGGGREVPWREAGWAAGVTKDCCARQRRQAAAVPLCRAEKIKSSSTEPGLV